MSTTGDEGRQPPERETMVQGWDTGHPSLKHLVRGHMLFGGAASIGEAFPDDPQVACATYRVLQEYCYRQRLSPRRVRWLHEESDLRAVRGKVTLVLSPHDFPRGFLAALRRLADDGLVEVEEATA